MYLKHFLLLVFSFAFVMSAHCDVGGEPPSAEELAKAPPWPKKFSGNLKECKKLDESLVLNKYHGDWKTRSPQHPITIEQIDLNLDGTCEILVLDTAGCGNKLCEYRGYQWQGVQWRELGDVFRGEFLEPYGGWIQIGSMRPSGANYYRALFRYSSAGASNTGDWYRVYRRDTFQHTNVSGVWKTTYVRTVYEK